MNGKLSPIKTAVGGLHEVGLRCKTNSRGRSQVGGGGEGQSPL